MRPAQSAGAQRRNEAMRIWYQSLVDGGRTQAYFDGLAARARSIARPGVEVQFASMPQGTYGSHVPAEVVIYPYIMSLNIQCILDNALKAEAEGYDVFAVGSVQDPGLEEARSLVEPGLEGDHGEAAAQEAGEMHRGLAVAHHRNVDQ